MGSAYDSRSGNLNFLINRVRAKASPPITEQLTVIAGVLLLIRHERKDRKLHSSRGNFYRRSFDCRKNSQRSRQRSERREHDR